MTPRWTPGPTRPARSPRALLVAVVMALLASTVVPLVATSPAPAAADVPPRVAPPTCVTPQSPGCLKADGGTTISASGDLTPGGQIAVQLSPSVPPCAHSSQSGCYIAVTHVLSPNCVYLPKGEPGGGQSCGFHQLYEPARAPAALPVTLSGPAINTRGTSTPCTGAFSYTYGPGGPGNRPDLVWAARGPLALGCTYTYNGTRPNALLGPTWIKAAGNITVCDVAEGNPANGYYCTKSHIETAEAWVWVDGDLAERGPKASFTVSQDEPGRVQFENTSTHPLGRSMTYEWDFGDGATSTAEDPEHLYAKPGDYPVTLHVTDFVGEEDDATATVTVAAPSLGASWEWDAESGTDRIGLDEELDVRLRVAATDGVGDVTGITIGNPFAGTPLTVLSGPTPTPPFDLAPGESTALTWRVKATRAGAFALRATPVGTDAAGREVRGNQAERSGRVNGLAVTIDSKHATADGGVRQLNYDNDGDGDIDDDDNRFDIELTIENLTDSEVTSLDLSKPDEPINFANNLVGPDDGAPRLTLLGMRGDDGSVVPVDVDLPDLAPSGSPGDSHTMTFVYEATGEVDAAATLVVRGVADGVEISGVGEGNVLFGVSRLVEAGFKLQDPFRLTTSGQVVRVDGYVENVDEGRKDADGNVIEEPGPVVVGVYPFVGGNAIGGYVTTQEGARTPLGVDPIVLAPGERVPVTAILGTTPVGVRTDAEVTYTVKAWRQGDEPGEMAKEIDSAQIEVVDDETYQPTLTQRLQFADLAPQSITACQSDYYAEIFSCNLVMGLQSLAVNTWEAAKLVPVGLYDLASAEYRVMVWYVRTVGTVMEAVIGDEAAKQRLVNEIIVQMSTWQEVGVMGQNALEGAEAMIVSFIDETVRVLREGDDKAAVAYFGKFLGENPDLGLAAVLKARTLAAFGNSLLRSEVQDTAGAIAREAAETAARTNQAEILERVDEAVAKGVDPKVKGEQVFKGGEDVTDLPKVWGGLYGAARRDVQNLLRIAREEGILIAFRSRSPISIHYLEEGLAWLKPQAVKAKNVNAIDVAYLGYPQDTLGKVVMVEPPVPWNLKGAELDAALDAHMDVLKSRHPELADEVYAAEVRDRLKLRTTKFGEHLDEWLEFGRGEGMPVSFDYAANGANPALDVKEFRKTRVDVEKVVDPYTGQDRLQFTLQVAGPDGNDFRFLTGDIDIVGFFNLDRSPIMDAAKREAIYTKMRSLLGMQHGETLTWDHLKRAEALRDHVGDGAETLMVAAPNERMYTGHLDERKSTPKEQLGANFAESFHLIGGPPAELVSAPPLGPPASGALTSLADKAEAANAAVSPWMVPGDLVDNIGKLKAEYAEIQAEKEQRKGVAPVVVRPDGTIEIYQLPPWLLDGGLPAPAAAPAAVAPAPLAVAPASPAAPLGPDPAQERSWPDGPAAEPGGSADLRAVSLATASDTPEGAAPAADAPVDALDGLDVIEQVLAAGGWEHRPTRPDVGAQGGSWRTLGAEEAVALDDPDVLELPLMSFLPVPSEVGATTIEVMSPEEMRLDPGGWFAPGDTVVVDPGGWGEEVARVVAVDGTTLTLDRPLAGFHPEATTVLYVDPTGADPTDPTDPTDPVGPVDPGPTTPPAGDPAASGEARPPTGPVGAEGQAAAPVALSGRLPYTGSDTSALVGWAVAAVVAGGALAALGLAGRRRRRSGP